MKRYLPLLFLLCPVIANSQTTSTTIFKTNQAAVVEIGTVNRFSGNGFLISSNGLILTANHVVATEDSKFKTYSPNLIVLYNGKAYPATPVLAVISDDQVNYDYAILKIGAQNTPHVSFGKWEETSVGDPVLFICNFPGTGPMLLQGSVSNVSSVITFLGPKPVNTILFQAPVRKGFSGSPIFDRKGLVIGVVNTEVFGISPALDELRKNIVKNRVQIDVGGVDFGSGLGETINNLDANLISGLGSGVSVDYARAAILDN